MPRAKAAVESALTRKGFKQVEGDHHQFIYHTTDGKKTRIRTKTSHSKKTRDIPDPLLGQMAKQCKLVRRDFIDLVDCPMDQHKYEEKLQESGAI